MNEQVKSPKHNKVSSTPVEIELQDAHLKLLSIIEQHPEYSQRRLAESLGISLGKTHYLLRALFEKGLVKAGKFGSSEQKLGYLYRLTPSGLLHRLQLTRHFLSRKEREFDLLKKEIADLRANLDKRPLTPGTGSVKR